MVKREFAFEPGRRELACVGTMQGIRFWTETAFTTYTEQQYKFWA